MSVRALAGWAGLMAGLTCVSLAAELRAEPGAAPESVTPAVPPRVELTIVGETPNAETLETRVLSWFRGQATTTVSSRSRALDSDSVLAPSSEPGVRVWIVLRTPTAARVFFAVQERALDSRRYLVNDVELDGGLDELGMEQLAQVVYLSAMGLWAGNLESSQKEVEERLRSIDVEQHPPPPRPKPRPAAKLEPPPPRASIRAGFEYWARYQGDEGLANGPGATFGIFASPSPHELGARLHAGLLLPRRLDATGVEIELRGASFALAMAVDVKAARNFWLSMEAGPGLDVVSYDTVSLEDSKLQPHSGDVDLRPLAFASFGLRAKLGSVNLGAAALLAVQLVRTHYDVTQDAQQSEILVPWLVQPGVSLGIFW